MLATPVCWRNLCLPGKHWRRTPAGLRQRAAFPRRGGVTAEKGAKGICSEQGLPPAAPLWKEQSTGELQRACQEQWVRFLAQIQPPWGSGCRDFCASHWWVRRCGLPSSGAFGRVLKLPNSVKRKSSRTQKGVQAPRCLPRGHLCCQEHHPSVPPSHLWFVTVPCLRSKKDVL